jgi:hypothetical protein
VGNGEGNYVIASVECCGYFCWIAVDEAVACKCNIECLNDIKMNDSLFMLSFISLGSFRSLGL